MTCPYPNDSHLSEAQLKDLLMHAYDGTTADDEEPYEVHSALWIRLLGRAISVLILLGMLAGGLAMVLL